MTNRLNIIISRGSLALCLNTILFVIAAAVPAVAHGGFEHVRGSVVKVANNVLTVKTATGDIDVKMDDHTDLTSNGQKAQIADLKAGARVIVDLPQGKGDRVAHSVKIGAVAKATDPHKMTSHK